MFRQKNPDIMRQEYMTVCSCHVRRFASILAIVFIVLNSLALIGSVIQLKPFDFCGNIVGIAVAACILVADKYERPAFYIPQIVMSAISLVFGVISIIALIVLMFFPPQKFIDFVDPEHKELKDLDRGTYIAILAVIIAVLVVCEVLGFFIWRIFVRAYRYMVDEVCSGARDRSYESLERGEVEYYNQ